MDLCERFHCLPSQLLDEDTELLQLLSIEHLGRRKAEQQQQQMEPTGTYY